MTKNKYFFDLLKNIDISSKLWTVLFFIASTLLNSRRTHPNKINFSKIFQKSAIFGSNFKLFFKPSYIFLNSFFSALSKARIHLVRNFEEKILFFRRVRSKTMYYCLGTTLKSNNNPKTPKPRLIESIKLKTSTASR